MEAAEDATNEIVAIGISEVSTDVIDAAEAVARGVIRASWKVCPRKNQQRSKKLSLSHCTSCTR